MGYSAQSITIAELFNELGEYYLPAIQREFVWPPEKIERLFDSLMREYPIGTMLRWNVGSPAVHDFQFYELIREYDVRKAHNIKANLSLKEKCFGILDGQQRITALHIGLLGSHTEKLPRLWWNNPDAFPKKKLYINLLFQEDEAMGQKYQIKFLTDSQAKHSEKAYWFLVGDILKYKSKDALKTFYRSTPHKDNDTFVDTLEALWNAIYLEKNIVFFAENRQDLDEVLEVFVRLNTGGTPLSYSDLLLSLATATWSTHDAREEVTKLVDELNGGYGGIGFSFVKDFVLKAILMLSDSDVRFRAVNIRKKEGLEDIWEGVKAALQTTVRLLRAFGIDGQTLTATMAVLPITYYLYRRGLATDAFLTHSAHKEDREIIRVWLLKMLLGRIFGSQVDATLVSLRDIIREEVAGGATTFPAEAILRHLNVRRGFAFSEEQVVALVSDTGYGSPYAFSLLALLSPSLNYQQSQFHMDHLHPAALFKQRNLKAAGLSDEEATFAQQHYNNLPNLHLLVGSDNIAKQDTPLGDWLSQRPDQALIRQVSMIPDGVDLSLPRFREFYEARRQRLIQELKTLLQVTDTARPSSEAASESADEANETANLVTGEPARG